MSIDAWAQFWKGDAVTGISLPEISSLFQDSVFLAKEKVRITEVQYLFSPFKRLFCTYNQRQLAKDFAGDVSTLMSKNRPAVITAFRNIQTVIFKNGCVKNERWNIPYSDHLKDIWYLLKFFKIFWSSRLFLWTVGKNILSHSTLCREVTTPIPSTEKKKEGDTTEPMSSFPLLEFWLGLPQRKSIPLTLPGWLPWFSTVVSLCSELGATRANESSSSQAGELQTAWIREETNSFML